MRGSWFIDTTFQPLEECYADEIEAEHLEKFLNQKINDESKEQTKGPLPGM